MQCNCSTHDTLPPSWQLAAFDTVEELARIGSYTWHPESDRLTWSDQLYRMFGMEPDRVTPSLSAFVDLVHEDDKALFARAIARAERREFGQPVELRIRRHDDGRERWLKIGLASKATPSSVDAAFFGIVADVTDERTLAHTLRHATDVLDRVESAGNLGSFEYDFTSDELTWSDQMSRIHGLEPGAARPNVRTILEVVHPDDRQRVAERLLSAFGGDPADDLHYRVLLGDGVERHLSGLKPRPGKDLAPSVRPRLRRRV